MPSSITHAYIACDVYKQLDKKIKLKLPKNSKEAYKTYAQGPDIYYFYHILTTFRKKDRRVQKFGSLLHNSKTNDLFIALTKQVKESKNTSEFLLLIGLYTHYITDSKTHPFINYQAKIKGQSKTRKDMHFFIETYIDNYFINKKEKISYKKFKGYNFCFNLKEDENIKNLLDNLMFKVFKRKNMGTYYFKGLKNMKFFFKYLRYDPIGYKRVIYNFLNFFVSKIFRDIRYLSYNFPLNQDDYLNLDHKSWYNLDDNSITSQASFLDLYQEVIDILVLNIEKLYDYVYLDKKLDLESFFENRSYSTGLIFK